MSSLARAGGAAGAVGGAHDLPGAREPEPRRRGSQRGSQRAGQRDSERGSAVPFVAVSLGVLLSVLTMVLAVGAVVADQRRVEAGADLAALAAAAALQQGGAPCAAATRILQRNGARLARCQVRGQEVEVLATRRTGRLLGHVWTTHSAARAGPQGAASGP